MKPPRQNRHRAKGTNPRAKGTNPRATGAIPVDPSRAWLESSARRGDATKRQALARLHSQGGYWCADCADTGWLHIDFAGGVVHCTHPAMTLADADYILHPDEDGDND